MCKKRIYKSYDHLEGRVKKAIKTLIGSSKGIEDAAAVISMKIWLKAYDELRNPTDSDISIGLYEYFGDTRCYSN